MSSVPHTYERWKIGVQPETDAGSELPLTLFSVTYPGLAELSKLTSSKNRLHPDVRETERERETA